MATVVKAAPASGAKPPMWLLVLVTLSGTMAMHMFMPALPNAARALHTESGAMQMAIGIYIVGLAVGQLAYGPLSDAFGRRPLLLVGLGLYTIGGLASAVAPTLPALLAGRLVQALGGSAGLTLGRAMVRDKTTPESAVRDLALLNVLTLVGPGVAPMVGGALTAAAGWRAIFVVLAALGAVMFACTWRSLPETSSPSNRFGVRVLLDDYRALLGSRRFVALTFGGGCASTSVYAFLSAAPFILVDELHRPVHEVGVYAGVVMAGFAVGNVLTSRLAPRGTPLLLRIGGALVLGSAVALFVAAWSGSLSVASAIVPMVVFTSGCGILSPTALAAAVSVDPRRVGSAAGLYGFTQMATGALCTALVATGADPARSASIVLLGATIASQIALFVARRTTR